jgi:hypothetical protein
MAPPSPESNPPMRSPTFGCVRLGKDVVEVKVGWMLTPESRPPRRAPIALASVMLTCELVTSGAVGIARFESKSPKTSPITLGFEVTESELMNPEEVGSGKPEIKPFSRSPTRPGFVMLEKGSLGVNVGKSPKSKPDSKPGRRFAEGVDAAEGTDISVKIGRTGFKPESKAPAVSPAPLGAKVGGGTEANVGSDKPDESPSPERISPTISSTLALVGVGKPFNPKSERRLPSKSDPLLAAVLLGRNVPGSIVVGTSKGRSVRRPLKSCSIMLGGVGRLLGRRLFKVKPESRLPSASGRRLVGIGAPAPMSEIRFSKRFGMGGANWEFVDVVADGMTEPMLPNPDNNP